MIEIFKCNWCSYVTKGITEKDKLEMLNHEESCCKNPKNKKCDSCKNFQTDIEGGFGNEYYVVESCRLGKKLEFIEDVQEGIKKCEEWGDKE